MTSGSSLNALLRQAAAHNNIADARQLIAGGANPYNVDERGMTAFNHAASNGLDVLRYLTEEAFADTQQPVRNRRWPNYGLNTPSGKYQSTLLTYACKVCRADMVDNMIAKGADTSIVNGSGWNLFHATAVMPGRLDVLKILRNRMENTSLTAQTTHEYQTDYDGNRVTYPTGATPYELCQARLSQDPNCPAELRDYLAVLTPPQRGYEPPSQAEVRR